LKRRSNFQNQKADKRRADPAFKVSQGSKLLSLPGNLFPSDHWRNNLRILDNLLFPPPNCFFSISDQKSWKISNFLKISLD